MGVFMMAFRSLLPHADRAEQPNTLGGLAAGKTALEIADELRGWQGLDGITPREDRARHIKYIECAVRCGVFTDWPEGADQ
jgi:hypothetical protein